MKTMHLFFPALILLAQAACTQPKDQSNNHAATHENQAVSKSDAPKPFQEQLQKVFEANVKINKALVASNAAEAAEAAQQLKAELDKVDMTLLEGQEQTDWMNYLETMNQTVKTIASAEDLSVQRKAFAIFSQSLYKSSKQFGVSGDEIYYQYCPMALNNQGAYWLSETKEILNPYFGDSMLKCGSTKEVIR